MGAMAKDAGNSEVVTSYALKVSPDSGISVTGDLTASEAQSLGENFDVMVGLDSEGFTPSTDNPWPTVNDKAVFGHFKDASGTVIGVKAVGSRLTAFVAIGAWLSGGKDFTDGEQGTISLQQSPM